MDISKIDKNFEICSQLPENIEWHSIREDAFTLYGLIDCGDNGFRRLPEEISKPISPALDTLSRETTHSWYVERYKPQYTTVSTQITKYMTGSETTLGPDVNRLSNTARRAVTPVFISLVVMIVILLMFYYFIMIYALKPIIEMNKSLGDWLRYKMPFKPKGECRDELLELKEKIQTVTNAPKKL